MLEELASQIASAPRLDFWIWAGPLALSVPLSFWWGFVRLRHSRIIQDLPTATIRAAHQGYVELEGVGKIIDIEIVCPLSGTPCAVASASQRRRRRVARGARA